MRNTNKKGFTIVELVVVVAVIAILAAVLIPTFSGVIAKANLSADQKAARDMNTILASTEIEEDDFGKLINTLADNGFNSKKALVPTSKDHVFYWYGTYNTIVLVNEKDEVVFPDNDKIKADYAKDKGTEVLYDLGNTVADSYDDLKTAIAAGGDVYLMNDVKIDGMVSINSGETNIYLNGHSLTRDSGTNVIYVNGANAVLNIYGDENSSISGASSYSIWVAQGTVNVYGGNMTNIVTGIYATGTGTANVYGGFFDCKGSEHGAKYTLNLMDSARNTANIVVKGGTFVNFNPADNAAEGPDTNFVADGYKVESETKANGDVWYTVVKAN